MQRIGLVLKCSEEQALLLGEKLCAFLVQEGKTPLMEPSCNDLAQKWAGITTDHISDEADLLVVLGGDGTILRAASLLNEKPVPVLGINLGRVGYMAEVSPEEALAELRSVIEGKGDLVPRLMLEVTLPDGSSVRALNDVVIHWSGLARLIDLGLRVGAGREIELRADGLIVSTPIGSSAYSYAAYGPLVHPDVDAIILTPVCPFWGLKRPIVVPGDAVTQLVLKRGEELTLTVDGHTRVPVKVGESIRVVRSPIPFVMVRTRDYFDVLKEKLNLL
jgi:NAD+ kinase